MTSSLNGGGGGHGGRGNQNGGTSRQRIDFDPSDSTGILAQLIRALYTSDNDQLQQLIASIRQAGNSDDVSSALQVALSGSTANPTESRAYTQLIDQLSGGRNGSSSGNISHGNGSNGDSSNGTRASSNDTRDNSNDTRDSSNDTRDSSNDNRGSSSDNRGSSSGR